MKNLINFKSEQVQETAVVTIIMALIVTFSVLFV
jgi:hypothetical protein